MTTPHTDTQAQDFSELLDAFELSRSEVSSATPLAALIVGPNEAAIAALIGCDEAEVAEAAQRLRANGIWTDDGHISLSSEAMDDPDLAFVEMSLWVLCANGLVEVAEAEDAQ